MSGRARRAVVASVADQGVAALTNLAVVVCVARQAGAADFASFAVAYAVFAVLLGAATAYVGQALVLRQGTDAEVGAHCRSAVAFTALAAAALGAALAAAAVPATAGGGVAAALAALGAVLPVVLTQDSLRFAFAALRRPHAALGVDTLRLAVAVPALAWLLPGGAGAAAAVLVWGASAVPALLAGLALLARHTRGAGPARPRALLARGHLGRRFVVEFGVGNAAAQLAVVGLGLFANPLAVGALRGAATLFGPLNVLFNAATGLGPPLLHRLPDDARRRARATAVAGVALAALAGGWALALALAPDRAGAALLGDTWPAAVALLPATGSQYVAMALGTCALLALRVLRPRATLPLQVAFSLFSVACLLVGYALGGVLGAAWGLCLGSAAKAAGAWLRTAAEVRARPPAPPAPAAAPGGGGGPGER